MHVFNYNMLVLERGMTQLEATVCRVSGLLMTVSGAMIYIFPCLLCYRHRVHLVLAEAILKQQHL